MKIENFIFIAISGFMVIGSMFLTLPRNIFAEELIAPCEYRTRVAYTHSPNELAISFANDTKNFVRRLKVWGAEIQYVSSGLEFMQFIDERTWENCAHGQKYQDRLVLIINAHGVKVQEDDIWFVTEDESGRIKGGSNIIDNKDIISAIKRLPKTIPVIVYVVSCYSGRLATGRLINELKNVDGYSMNVFASSGPDETTWLSNLQFVGTLEELSSVIRKFSDNLGAKGIINNVKDLGILFSQAAIGGQRLRAKAGYFFTYYADDGLVSYLPPGIKEMIGGISGGIRSQPEFMESPVELRSALPSGYKTFSN